MVKIYQSRMAALGLILFAATAMAQEPAPRATLWSFLGIPQAADRMNAGLMNRRGNRPGMEKKPPLKRLGDPANLESDVPAIKKAAEIKQAEDLKPQKIKAVKYLAQIGCGCYDADGSVTEALIAAMTDCTEEVRLETVQAISEAASRQCCPNCGATCCCNEKISEQLFQLSQGVDDAGCPIEPSARVREAAMQALRVCCPARGPVMVAPEEEEPAPPERRETGEPETPTPAVPEPAPESPAPAALLPAPAVETADTPVRTVRVESLATARLSDDDEPVGVIIHTDAGRRLAHVHFAQESLTLAAGSTVTLYEKSPAGTRYRGELEVVQGFSGSANVRPKGSTNFASVRVGHLVIPGPAPVRVQ